MLGFGGLASTESRWNMAQIIESGRLIEAILAFTIAEWVALAAFNLRTGRGVAPAAMSRNLVSGMFLLLALREALVRGWWGWIAASLGLAFLAHLADLRRLWRS